MRRRWRLLILVVCVGVTAAGAGLFCFWHFRFKPWAIWEKTRYGNMQTIAIGVREFARETKHLPKGLEDLVQSGHLPQRSPIYQCPMLHDSLRDETISYSACEFDIRFEPN